MPVFGSFFPVWLLAAALGVLATVVLRALLMRAGLDEHLPMPPLVYLCSTILFGILIWAVWSGGFKA